MEQTRTREPAGQEWRGGAVSERAECVLCPNPSPMTLDGTNTWILGEPGASEVIVIDPGPDDPEHLARVMEQVRSRDARVGLTLLTHGHADHAEGAERFAALSGAATRRAAVAGVQEDLSAGESVTVGGLDLVVVPTPGHTADSVSFVLPAENRLLTGDTILGRGSSVVAHPDGDLGSYLDSLAEIERLTSSGEVTSLLPGHGPFVPDAAGTVQWYMSHRQQRLERVASAAHDISPEPGQDLADAIVATVYTDVPKEVWPAARLTVVAQLEYLRGQ